MAQHKRKLKKIVMAMVIMLIIAIISLFVLRRWVHDSKIKNMPLKTEQIK